MSADSGITQQEYIELLKQQPHKGQVVTTRLTNKRGIALSLLTEPSGDEAPPLASDASYDLVAQAPQGEHAIVIDIEDDCLRVWFTSPTGTEGNVFFDGVSVLNQKQI